MRCLLGAMLSQFPRSKTDGQPIEGSDLSGSHVTSPSLGESEQRLKRIRRVVRRTARKADGIEGSKDEVAQQASIRLRRQNACALCMPDKLVLRRHMAAPQRAGADPAESAGRVGEHGDRVVTHFVHRAGTAPTNWNLREE
jgi:hypothetical protein